MEYLVRFICSPRKWRFFKQPMNLVDFFAIIPFMLDLVIGGLQVWYLDNHPHGHHHHHSGQDFEIMGKAGKIVRLVRVMRVMRIFKLVRHFAGLQSLIYTLNQVSQPQPSSSYQLSFTPFLLGLQGAGVAHVAGGGRGPHICFSSLLCREGHQRRREIFYKILIFSG